ncbi:pentapeptide repeat-containing protein [Corynebacterium alimapuense]|uniref:Pentapeptide repeat-containing protein n=1 Tax=Corynebacterium alimapuense TaxID=1576874 RepID=A0A3M8K4A9_9CORY|nr:pentapeptide repeat-containing protein [Corynebacterium alimapuense]RNE48057.1 hypothetical protein C5L39_10495 [Corynebacterium alimapuense]
MSKAANNENTEKTWPLWQISAIIMAIAAIVIFVLVCYFSKNTDAIELAQPAATIVTGAAIVLAAWIAFTTGNRNRKQEAEIAETTRKQEAEIAETTRKQEAERDLRDRFFKITETLSESDNYVKREAGVYALAALADDWEVFHDANPDAAKREQQTCLNVIGNQLRDPLKVPDPADKTDTQSQEDLLLLTFKHRVQEIIMERFKPSVDKKTGRWSSLDLDLSNCHLHEIDAVKAVFRGNAKCDGATFGNDATFDGATFGNDATFDGATFGNNTTFDGATFGNNTTFNNAKFDNDTSFDGAKFGNNTGFFNATFGNNTGFDNAKLGDNTTFIGATFGNNTGFFDATLGDNTTFIRATFGNNTSFDDATFGKNIFFIGATRYGDIFFENAEKIERSLSQKQPISFINQIKLIPRPKDATEQSSKD